MKKLLLRCGSVLVGLYALQAVDPALVLEKTALPKGPVLKKAAGFSQWQIDFSYSNKSRDAAGHGGHANPESPELPRQVTVTRTKPLWHAVLVLVGGKKTELWFDGDLRYEVGPEPSTVVPIAEFNPDYNPPFLEHTTNDFPDMDWVSPKTYLGSEKASGCWVFEKEGATAWIDSKTRLPVRWQKGGETRVFKFLPTPKDPLIPPASIAKFSEGLK